MLQGKAIFFAVVLLGFMSRALPHPDNFTPILAMAIVAGAFAARRWVAIALPLLSMALSDLVLNNTLYSHYYDGFAGLGPILDNGFTYLALLVLAVLPLLFTVRDRQRWSVLAAFGVSGSVMFFLISNFGVWLGSTMYPTSLAGLGACYLAGLPFYPATLVSTVVYGAVAVATLKGFGVSRTSPEQQLA